MSSSEKPVTSASSPLSEGLKRKRGRPKKQPQEEAVGPPPAKKPRGRPRGSKKVNAVSQMVEPSAEKRPRGRPRKWPPLERARQEGSPAGSTGSSTAALPATPGGGTRHTSGSPYRLRGTAGEDGSRLSTATALRRSLSNVPAAAQ